MKAAGKAILQAENLSTDIGTSKMNNDWKDESERFVLYLDIMGFKERINREPILKLKSDLLEFRTKNEKLKPLLRGKTGDGEHELLKMAQFSDSIVVISKGNSTKDLNLITKAAVILMQTALETGFALRGAIACGQILFDETNQLFFGKALVDAYLLEEELGFYGVVYHETTEKIIASALASKDKDKPRKTYFPIEDSMIPLKKGKSFHYHVAWYKMTKILNEGQIYDNVLEWLKKLRHTVSGNPRIYLDNTKRILDDIRDGHQE